MLPKPEIKRRCCRIEQNWACMFIKPEILFVIKVTTQIWNHLSQNSNCNQGSTLCASLRKLITCSEKNQGFGATEAQERAVLRRERERLSGFFPSSFPSRRRDAAEAMRDRRVLKNPREAFWWVKKGARERERASGGLKIKMVLGLCTEIFRCKKISVGYF